MGNCLAIKPLRPLFEYISEVLCNIDVGCPSETQLKLKSREISFVHNFRLNNPIVLKFCKEHGSITAVLWAKCQNDWTTKQMAWTNENWN